MFRTRRSRPASIPLLPKLTVVLGLFAAALSVDIAVADNGINPSLGGVDAEFVRANNEAIGVPDPEGDLASSCGFDPATNPVNNYGFDCGPVFMWYDQVADEMFVVVETYGHIGDANGDGGYDSETSNCGGYPQCTNAAEGDTYDNVFNRNVEIILLQFDRNCDGFPDLYVELTGTAGNGDRVTVTVDDFTSYTGADLGAIGEAWTGLNTGNLPLQPGPDPVCIQERAGALLWRFTEWSRYFQAEGGVLLHPRIFNWRVLSRNTSDMFTPDEVPGSYSSADPRVDVSKEFDRAQVHPDGGRAYADIVVTNTGNVALTQVSIADFVSAGLVFTGGFIDDPQLPLGPPAIVTPGEISWTGLAMEPGESRAVRIEVETLACDALTSNEVLVEGRFESECLGTGDQAVPVFAAAMDDLACVVETLVRGDDDGSGEINISDVFASLQYQFQGGALSCLDAADFDDSGEVNISDPFANLQYQFAGGAAPEAPFPACGIDPTPDALGCACAPLCMSCLPAPVMAAAEQAETARVSATLGQPGPLEAGRVRVPVLLETDRPLWGFEYTVETPAGLRYAGVESRHRDFDFLSGRPTGPRVRVGTVVRFDLEGALEPGRHEVAELLFEGDGPLAGLSLTGGIFSQAGGRSGEIRVESPGDAPLRGVAARATPNPFLGSTRVHYTLSEAGAVTVEVHDASGRRVRTLVEGIQGAGGHTAIWDGTSDEGTPVATGLYFLRVLTATGPVSEKVLRIR